MEHKSLEVINVTVKYIKQTISYIDLCISND